MRIVSLLAKGMSAATNSTPGLHKGRDESQVAGKPIELSNDKPRLVLLADMSKKVSNLEAEQAGWQFC